MAEPEILCSFDDANGIGCVTLNRAKKLNALNLNMIRLLHEAIDKIDQKSAKLSCVIMDGAGGKSFCAGGDVEAVRAEALVGGSLPADFFYEEYGVVYRLATMYDRTGCCQVSLWDGIVMGGGVGLSAHGPIRVVTEKTVFAKPEMSIGFFPDVGSTHLLGRLDHSVGVFIGCTGSRLTAWDCIRCGLATHYVPSANIRKLRDLLVSKCRQGLTGVAARAACEEAVLEAGAGAQPSSSGAVLTDEHVGVIGKCFSAPTLEEILERLRADPGDFAQATLKTMRTSCSPTSCKVTLRAIRDFAAPNVSIGHVLSMEYRLSQRFCTRPQPLSDFYEGIRAVLVDKDRKQKWQPGWDSIQEITEEMVAAFFVPLESNHRRGELVCDEMWVEARRKPFPMPLLKSNL
jgi:enoyl-CoA hydratase/carnithine racemase